MSTSPQPGPERSVLDRMAPIWALVFYSSLLLGLLTLQSAVGLLSWQVGGALALSLASGALFQGLFARRFSHEPAAWPLPAGLAWLYFGAQALLLGALLQLDRAFVGLSFALIGQIMGSLRPRQWPLPLLGFFALMSFGVGLLEDPGSLGWLDLVGLVFSILITVVLGLLIHLLFTQRYRLLHLVDELRRAKAAVEAASAEREELAALRERTRLAREMHDSLGHALVLVNVKLEAAQRLYARDHGRGDAELEATRELVRGTMAELRSSLASLRAPEQLALPEALAQLAASVGARGGVQVELALPEGGPAPSPAADDALRKIAREALANVERHAGARRAWLELARGEGAWLLRVSDDGRGLRPADLRKPGHFGVVGMRERAEGAGGALSIGQRPGGGTVVEARLPEG